MTQITDMFKPDVLFSKENPFLKSAEKTHRIIFESFDKTARLQLDFAKDLLNLNRKRFDALYADDTLQNRISAHQDLATELGKRAATWAGDLQEVVTDMQSSVSDAANDLIPTLSTKKNATRAPSRKAKKAKAA